MRVVSPSGSELAARYALVISDPNSPGEAIAEAMAWAFADQAHERQLNEAMRFLDKCDGIAESIPEHEIVAEVPDRSGWFAGNWKLMAVAASFALIFTGIGMSTYWQKTWPFHAPQPVVVRNFASRVGETRTVRLSDRASVTLGGDTAINASYDDSLRHVALVKGQALLKLASSDGQPITVDVGAGALQVDSAAFDVERSDTGSTITVADGMVMVDSAAGQAAAPLAAGMQMTAYVDGTFSPPTKVNVEAVTSWCNGLIQFADERLAQVVEKLNRYSKVPIVIAGDDLGRERVSGIVEANKIGEWLSGLVQVLDIDVVRLHDGPVVLRQRAARTKPMSRNLGEGQLT